MQRPGRNAASWLAPDALFCLLSYIAGPTCPRVAPPTMVGLSLISYEIKPHKLAHWLVCRGIFSVEGLSS